MADRYFPNEMTAFVDKVEFAAAAAAGESSSSLSKLLYLPYPKAAEIFLRAALQIKEKVLRPFGAFPQTLYVPIRNCAIFSPSFLAF